MHTTNRNETFLAFMAHALILLGGCGSHEDERLVVAGEAGAPRDGGVLVADGGAADGARDGSAPGLTLPEGGAVVLPRSTTPYVVDQTGESGLPAQTIATLRDAAAAAGAGSGGLNGGANPNASSCTDLLYPYEGSVMPGGIISPPWMFAQGFDAAYVRAGFANSDLVDYELASAAALPGELRIPPTDWANIVSRTPSTSLTLTFSFVRGGVVSSCVARLTIAPGNMTGAIYYNTYNHPQSSGTGAVLRLTLGQPTPEMYLRESLAVAPIGPCIGCHSLSADGSTLAASTHLYVPAGFAAKSYAVGAALQPNAVADIKDAAFGGITPDGLAIFRMGNPDCTAGANIFPRAKNNFPFTLGPTSPGLVSMQTGNDVASTGLVQGHFYWMPQFSPDGRHVVFNDAHLVDGSTERRTLAVADYDVATHTFSAPRVILDASRTRELGLSTPARDYRPSSIGGAAGLFSGAPGNDGCGGVWNDDFDHTAFVPAGSCDGPCYPAWPFFTPDGKGIVFSMTSEPDFAAAFPGRETPAKSELWYIDVATAQAVRLDNANKSVNKGNALDNYYPTVLPVQVGGYYWLFWTSRRDFGHVDLAAPFDAALSGALIGSSAASDAFRKRIWVSALVPPGVGEFAAGALSDPSSPPFYLEGQSATGNTRAFAALNPCKNDGDACQGGLDCCTGFCNVDRNTGRGSCGSKIRCANLNERCETTADCCPPADTAAPPYECLGNFCGFLTVR